MPLKILLIIFSCVFLSACIAPKKPTVEICHIDYPEWEGICQFGGEKENLPKPNPLFRRQLADLDKATCFAPKEWEKVQNYIDQLEAYIQLMAKEQ